MSDRPPLDSDFHIEDQVWESYTTEARQEGPMLTPAEIRSRGDRRRTTRRIGVTAAALVVAVAAGAAIGVPLLRSDSDIASPPSSPAPSTSLPQSPTTSGSATSVPPTSTPASSAPASSAPPSSAPPSSAPPSSAPPSSTIGPARPLPDSALPNTQQIYLREPGDMGVPYYMDGLGTGSDEPTLWICENGITTAPGIISARTAIFSADGVIRRAHLIELGSNQEALGVAATIRGWNASCTDRLGSQGGKPVAHDDATTTIDGAQVDFSVQQLHRSDGDSAWNGVLVIVKENRVLIIVDTVIGQDYNAVGPGQHATNPDLPLVATATHLDEIIAQMMNK